MKLLLTSAGITNDAIKQAFYQLVGKDPGEIKLAFIPTAANVKDGNKSNWLFEQYEVLKEAGVSWIDMIDFSASEVDWKSRLDECDVLYVTGGNTFYLLDQIRKRGFEDYLSVALETKVYVGGSASSITMTPTIEVAAMPPGDPNIPGLTDLNGLGYVDFEIEPHCNQERFDAVEAYAKAKHRTIYAIDDQTAIMYVNGKVDVISEGSWKLFDNHS